MNLNLELGERILLRLEKMYVALQIAQQHSPVQLRAPLRATRLLSSLTGPAREPREVVWRRLDGSKCSRLGLWRAEGEAKSGVITGVIRSEGPKAGYQAVHVAVSSLR